MNYQPQPAPGQPGSLEQQLVAIGIYLGLRQIGMERERAWNLARVLATGRAMA